MLAASLMSTDMSESRFLKITGINVIGFFYKGKNECLQKLSAKNCFKKMSDRKITVPDGVGQRLN